MEIIEDSRKLDEIFPFDMFRITMKKEQGQEADQVHWHKYCEISLVLGGSGSYFVNGNRYHVSSGDIVLFNDTEVHAWNLEDSELELLVMIFPTQMLVHPNSTFDQVYLEPFLDRDGAFTNRIGAEEEESCSICELLFTIEKEYAEHKPAWILLVKAYVAAVMGMIYRCLLRMNDCVDNERDSASEKGKAVKRLEEVLLYINEHYAERITLNQAASIACMSPNYFSSYFKRIIGMGFSDYLISLRLERVEELSRTTSVSIEQIAASCGFRNMSNFYRLQKKHAALIESRKSITKQNACE